MVVRIVAIDLPHRSYSLSRPRRLITISASVLYVTFNPNLHRKTDRLFQCERRRFGAPHVLYSLTLFRSLPALLQMCLRTETS